MKGETDEAVRLLESIVAQGDQEDKEVAYFYLGKIQELAGNKISSNFYYKQSLSRTNKTRKSYWLAERDAATGTQTESFLQPSIPIKGHIKKVFGEGPTFCLFQDGSIAKIENQKVISIPTELPDDAQILHIGPRGFWFHQAGNDSLHFLQFHSSLPRYSFNVPKPTDYSFQNDHALIQGDRQLTIISKNGIQAVIVEKYTGCTVEGFFKPTSEYILNCPDNALHFISSENGSEERTISQFDVIQKTLISKNLLYIVSNGFLYCYLPQKGTSPIWKISTSNAESMFAFESNIALLESSGRITLLDKTSGLVRASVRSDATRMYPLAQGTIGLFNEEGTITAIDTLLHPLWNFSFSKPAELPPIKVYDDIYFYFGNRKIQPILPKYYGKRILQSEIYAKKVANFFEQEQWDSLKVALDTLFKLEPGNAEGWFFKALYLEKMNSSERERQAAWSEAVRLSASNPRVTKLILSRYGKSINAKHISLLPISPKTRYPQLFGNKKDLFTLDPAGDRLFCINADNGELKWSRNIGKQENSPVVGNDEKILAVASGYTVNFYDLTKESSVTSVQLPGKAFETKVYDNATYITTWNGFLLKILRGENKLAWSRKIYALPFFMVKNHNLIYACNLEGEFQTISDESGQISEGYSKKLQGTITHMVSADSIVAIASSNSKLFIFNPSHKDRLPFQILMESSIASLKIVNHEDTYKLLVGLADQSILLYSKDGAPLWRYKGKNSIFTSPFAKDNEVWLDQGNELISLSMKDGTVLRRFSTPGGAGTPFIMNRTLYSASPKRILYGFSL